MQVEPVAVLVAFTLSVLNICISFSFIVAVCHCVIFIYCFLFVQTRIVKFLILWCCFQSLWTVFFYYSSGLMWYIGENFLLCKLMIPLNIGCDFSISVSQFEGSLNQWVPTSVRGGLMFCIYYLDQSRPNALGGQ